MEAQKIHGGFWQSMLHSRLVTCYDYRFKINQIFFVTFEPLPNYAKDYFRYWFFQTKYLCTFKVRFAKYTVDKWKEKTRAELIKPCHSHDGWRHWKFVVDFGRACCTHDFFFDYVVLTENWEWVLSLEYTQSTFIRNNVFTLSSQSKKKSWVQLALPKSTTNFKCLHPSWKWHFLNSSERFFSFDFSMVICFLIEVQLFWEGHKNFRNLLHGLDIYNYKTSKPWEWLRKFLWPSQKKWTLLRIAKLNQILFFK